MRKLSLRETTQLLSDQLGMIPRAEWRLMPSHSQPHKQTRSLPPWLHHFPAWNALPILSGCRNLSFFPSLCSEPYSPGKSLAIHVTCRGLLNSKKTQCLGCNRILLSCGTIVMAHFHVSMSAPLTHLAVSLCRERGYLVKLSLVHSRYSVNACWLSEMHQGCWSGFL